MIFSIYLDTSLEHCSKGQKIEKHIYCVKIKLLLQSCQMLYYLTLLKSKIKKWLVFKLETQLHNSK